MEAEFRAPNRRARVQEVYHRPFPLNNRPLTAHLINRHVIVTSQEDATDLYRQGFFGKGVLSKSGPVNCVSDQWENVEGLMFPVVSNSRYSELLHWAGQTLSAQGLDETAVCHKLDKISSNLSLEHVRSLIQCRDDQSSGSEIKDSTEQASSNCHSHSSPQPGPQPNPQPGPQPGPQPDPHSSVSVPGPGFVLVKSESSTEIRHLPISITEFLQLSHEEAFFLVYALGVLTVYHRQVPLSVLQLWRTFRSISPDFVSFYSAYHFYRSKGWIPKTGSGAKYGSDMMLYRKGPPFYHASYSVVVQRMTSSSPLRQFSWRSLAALSRVTANVNKELLLCYIIFPLDQSEAELDSPDCLLRLQVQEVMVSRWVSSKERSDQDDD